MKSLFGDRVLLVDILAGLFGMGAWLSINAMYTQLPILIASAPESWNLASYIVILIQAANIGGIVYSLLKRHASDPGRLERIAIYLLEALGVAALLFMAFFYQEVSQVGGQPHSVALLGLVFVCALLACTSSVLFVPYMNRLAPTYLVSYMIGEGLSSLLPSAVSLVQGVSGDPECVDGQSYTPPPVFSTRTYLLAAAGLQAVSLAAFALLDLLPACQRARAEERKDLVKDVKNEGKDDDKDNGKDDVEAAKDQGPARQNVGRLLVTQGVLMLLSNGLFPSIQSYSCEPYGTSAYHLAINLGAIANPLACYLLFFVVPRKTVVFDVLAGVALAVGVYIFVGAKMSPTPPLVGTVGGQVLVVVVWVLFTALVSYTKLSIASALRERHPRGLFLWGAVTQAGSLVGAVLAVVLLDYTNAFVAYTAPSPCA